MMDRFTLPDRLDSSAAAGLAAALRERAGKPLILDAGKVEVIGALAFEVIIAAGRQWEADGLELSVDRRSPRFLAACGTLGLCGDAPWRSDGLSSGIQRELGA